MSNLENGYPEHIAIIMDGNRRWARSKGLDVKEGHKNWIKADEAMKKNCAKKAIMIMMIVGISFLTDIFVMIL